MVTTVSTKPAPNTSWWIYLLEGIGASLSASFFSPHPAGPLSPSPFFSGGTGFSSVSSSWRARLLIAPFLGIGRCSSACSASPPASWF